MGVFTVFFLSIFCTTFIYAAPVKEKEQLTFDTKERCLDGKTLAELDKGELDKKWDDCMQIFVSTFYPVVSDGSKHEVLIKIPAPNLNEFPVTIYADSGVFMMQQLDIVDKWVEQDGKWVELEED